MGFTTCVQYTTYIHNIIHHDMYLLEGWQITHRMFNTREWVREGDMLPPVRSAKLKVIHGLKKSKIRASVCRFMFESHHKGSRPQFDPCDELTYIHVVGTHNNSIMYLNIKLIVLNQKVGNVFVWLRVLETEIFLAVLKSRGCPPQSKQLSYISSIQQFPAPLSYNRHPFFFTILHKADPGFVHNILSSLQQSK